MNVQAAMPGPGETADPIPVADIGSRIDDVLEVADGASRALVAARPEHTRAATLALWHVRGQAYHTRNLFGSYQVIAGEVGSRILAAGGASAPEMLIMHSPETQELLFEFYALVMMARISLDALRDLLLPLFAPSEQTLPNSITGVLKGSTNCPVYQDIVREPVFRYLVDVRDCLVHHKTLASGDHVVAVKEGADVTELTRNMPAAWLSDPVIKASYRRVSELGIALNILLPDQIYEHDAEGGRGRLIKPFTYELGVNVLTQSVEFLRFGAFQVVSSFTALRESEGSPFSWSKARSGRRT